MFYKEFERNVKICNNVTSFEAEEKYFYNVMLNTFEMKQIQKQK